MREVLYAAPDFSRFFRDFSLQFFQCYFVVDIPEKSSDVGAAESAAKIVKEVTDTHSDHVSWIGATLVAGFIFMLLIDQISHKLSSAGQFYKSEIIFETSKLYLKLLSLKENSVIFVHVSTAIMPLFIFMNTVTKSERLSNQKLSRYLT